MINTRINLGITDLSRSIAETPDVDLINRYFEKDPTNLDDQVSLLSRPGLKKWLEVGDGPIRAVYSQPGSFNDDLFVVSEDTLYRVGRDESILEIGVLGGNTGFVSMTATDITLFVADGSGLWYYRAGATATGTLTASGAVVNNDVVVLGTMYYKFTNGSVDAGTPSGNVGNPWLVAMGADTAAALSNLRKAINASGVAGTAYSTVLIQNTSATASANTATTVSVTSLLIEALGNAVVTTETGANIAWGAATLTGGVDTDLISVAVPDGDGVISVATINGFVICVVAQDFDKNGRFYFIRPEAVIIDPLDFATAERSPDGIHAVMVVGDLIWFLGNATAEIWYPSGDGDAPFFRQQGRLFDKGTWEGTVIQIKDDIMAVGTDGVVYRIGASPQIVSTPGISQRIREAIDAQREG